MDFNAKKVIVFLAQKVFGVLKNNQLGFSSLFKLVCLKCMNAIKNYLKGEVQSLKVGALIEKGCKFENNLASWHEHQQKTCQSTCLKVH